MFGRNASRRRETAPLLQVQDVFFTLQGEGPFSGHQAVFVRLTGCNLKCWFCDTAWDDEKDQYVAPAEIAERASLVAPTTCNLAVITGGEPCRQDLEILIKLLRRKGFTRIQIETAGSFWQPILNHPVVTVVLSPKTAYVAPEFLTMGNVHWKYVINANEVGEDGLPSGQMQRKGEDGRTGGVVARPPEGALVYLQPCDEQDTEKNVANLLAVRDSALKHGHIAAVQLHKLVGVE
jgi:organic radical activating enzyme